MTAENSIDSGHDAPRPGGNTRPAWTFLTNHGHVLLSVARYPDIRVTDIAERVGITTRAALQILKDLEEGGYLQRSRVGRRTHYIIRPHQHFRHPSTAAQEVDGLISLFTGPLPGGSAAGEQ
ncbi:helix-turn-helix transcriptional regulator [Pseudarthrobacter sp. NPDC058362]|uniref:helix-turn-helix transcriptional regulator n=1 Tax=Pseudarthrobacter sp. NPDC058362 TaxID=3346458 RepID=UPI003660090F